MIPQEQIEQIRQANDIVDVIGSYARLKKRGRSFIGLCPFHTEKTPSFTVSQEKQVYHCFGCGVGGNVFTFLIEHEKMSFIEAVRFLARRANITIRETGADYRRDERDKLNYAQQVALDYFRSTLNEPRYRVVREDYLKQKRGITEEAIEFFQLGLSGEGWEGLIQYAAGYDLTPADLERAGLAVHNEQRNSYFDRFRQRLMFPIFNLSRKPIAFGGRTLKKGEPAKYVNSPETLLYSKSNVLYGLNFARESLRQANCAYIVEGYFDVISLWQIGIKNVVASSGTAFTLQQARLLARFVEDVYLFFDADSAGQQAALKSVDMLYDAGLEVKIILAPEGEDPDSLARESGREQIEELRQAALSYIPFRVRNLGPGKTGIIAREKLIKEMKATGEKIGDATRRSLFFREAADALNIDVQVLQSAKIDRPSTTETPAPKRKGLDRTESALLSLLLSNPSSIDAVFEKISPDDFGTPQLKRLYSAMINQHREAGGLDATQLVEMLADQDAVSLLTEIATEEWSAEKTEAETLNLIRAFKERKAKLIRVRLQEELREAEARGDNERAAEIVEELKAHGL